MGVLAMQEFFGSPQYSSQARSIAALLLPNVSNVYAFDEVLSTMGPPHTDRGNYHHLTGIAQMLGFDQRAKFHISGAASKKRSEEHTSELQSRLHLVCRLLLEKKKKNKNYLHYRIRKIEMIDST